MRTHRSALGGLALATAMVMLTACGSGGSGGGSGGDGFEPEQPVSLVVPFSAGGGVDLAGRTVARILQEQSIIDGQIDVENVDGGSGLVGMSRIKGLAGDDNALMVTGAHIVSSPLLTPDSGVSYTDFTPLATIYAEYVYFFVKPDSDISDIAALAARMKDDPAGVTIGGSVPGGPSNLAVAEFAESVDVDPTQLTYVPYDGDEAVSAVLGGSIDVVSAGPEGMDLATAGKLRVLAVSSAEPLTGRDEGVPTWSDAGSDASFENFRIVSGPGDMPEEAVTYWKDALTKMSETPEWKEAMETNGWAPFFQTDGLDDYLAEQNTQYKTLLSDLGITSG